MAGEDKPYTEWIRSQPCCACGGPGPCEVHHSTNGEAESTPKGLGGRRGLSQRAHDHESMPLHLKCHRQFHDHRGPFEGWDRARRRAWQDEQVRLHRERYETEQAATVDARETTKAPPPRFDAKEAAQRFCEVRELGEQIAFDLEREIKNWIWEARG